MNLRQRVLMTLNHGIPDRVPIDFGGFHAGIHIKAYNKLLNHLGIVDNKPTILDPIQRLAKPCEELLKRFHVDIRYIWPEQFQAIEPQCSFKDEFGVTWTMQENQQYMTVSNHPLAYATISDIEDYPFPNCIEKSCFADIREKAIEISQNGSYALSTGIGGSIFETCCNLRGLEKWFIDTIENPELCETLLDKVLQYWLDYYTKFLSEIGDLVDIVMIGDDLAGQNGPLFSLDFYHKFLKPRHKKLIEHIKSFTKSKVCYHTCGSCFDFIPDLIDIGIDVLNPVQTGLKNMEPQKIKDTFGKQISLWGGSIDAQQLIAFSSPEQIPEQVRKNIEIFKQDAGYIFSNTHNIQFDVPPENIVALFDAAYEFGFYD